MTAATAAWRHSLTVNGADENQPPSQYGVTPASIIDGTVGTRVAYTPEQLAIIALDDDLTFVNANASGASLTTSRANHLFEHSGVTGTVALMSFLTKYSHQIGLNPSVSYREKMYVWDNVTGGGQWEELDAFNGGGIITLTGAPSGPLANYVDGLDRTYVIQWDWEGVRHVQAGCIHEDSVVRLADGSRIRVKDVRPSNRNPTKVFGRALGRREARIVDEVTYHHPVRRRMVTITCGRKGSLTVTEDHDCAVGSQALSRRADLVKVGDVIPDAHGKVWPVTHVKHEVVRAAVVDIDMRSRTYGVGDNELLVRTMARA